MLYRIANFDIAIYRYIVAALYTWSVIIIQRMWIQLLFASTRIRKTCISSFKQCHLCTCGWLSPCTNKWRPTANTLCPLSLPIKKCRCSKSNLCSKWSSIKDHPQGISILVYWWLANVSRYSTWLAEEVEERKNWNRPVDRGGSGGSDEPPIVLGANMKSYWVRFLHGPHSQNGGVIYSLAYQQSCNQPPRQPAWELHGPRGWL